MFSLELQREHPQLTREELERAFAHTLDDAQSEFQAEIVKTLQVRHLALHCSLSAIL